MSNMSLYNDNHDYEFGPALSGPAESGRTRVEQGDLFKFYAHHITRDPTAIATSALLTHWQSLTRRLKTSYPVSNRLQQLAWAGRRPVAESAHNKTLQ